MDMGNRASNREASHGCTGHIIETSENKLNLERTILGSHVMISTCISMGGDQQQQIQSVSYNANIIEVYNSKLLHHPLNIETNS